MFRITEDPSSGNFIQCLAKNYRNVSIVSVDMDVFGVMVFIYIYTGCNRRNGPDFGRVFLMLNYTDITQNTYIQS